MTVMHNTETYPDGDPIANKIVLIKLWSAPAYSDQFSLEAIGEVKTDSDGYWELDLTPTNDLIPDGEIYLAQLVFRGGTVQHRFTVPDSGPEWIGDHLADPPGTLESSALAAHLLDPEAHGGIGGGGGDHPDSDHTTLTTVISGLATEVTNRTNADLADRAFAIQRPNHTGVQPQSSVTNLVPDLALKADLVGGKVPDSQMGSLVISEHLGVVGSQAAMLALVGQRGDWATRSDLSADFMIIAEPSSVLGNWRQFTTPASPVSSVNGRSGAVTGLSEATDLTTHTATGVHTTPQPPIIGSTASTAVAGNDSRLSDARTPVAHNHSASNITSGTMATARLGSGTADTTVFLRGDQQWAPPPGGGSSVDEELWTPADLAPGAILSWGKPEDLPAVAAGVSSWGLVNPLTQATSGSRPTVVSTGPNGFKAASFDGTDDYLAASYTNPYPDTVFMVFKLRSFTHTAIPLGSPVYSRAFREITISGRIHLLTSYGYENIVYCDPGLGRYVMVGGRFNFADTHGWIDDGTAVKTGQPGTGGINPGGLSIGGLVGSNNSAIDVCEFLHLNGLPTPLTKQRITRYFGKKFSMW